MEIARVFALPAQREGAANLPIEDIVRLIQPLDTHRFERLPLASRLPVAGKQHVVEKVDDAYHVALRGNLAAERDRVAAVVAGEGREEAIERLPHHARLAVDEIAPGHNSLSPPSSSPSPPASS